jgi:outer membrane protein TolC
MGLAGQNVNIIPDYFVKKPTELFKPAPSNIIIDHPLAKLRAQDVDVAKAKVYVLNRTWYPHLWLRSGIWGRGSGLRSDPRVAAAGTLPQTGNYSVGFTIGFPFFDYFEIKAKTRMQKSDEQAQRANYDLAWQVLTQKDARAKVMLDNARKIADETPILLNAAKENEIKALERYKVGLTDIVEIAEAERILAKAEVEDAVAEVRVWEAILTTSYAQGDLKPFLDLVKAAQGGN